MIERKRRRKISGLINEENKNEISTISTKWRQFHIGVQTNGTVAGLKSSGRAIAFR